MFFALESGLNGGDFLLDSVVEGGNFLKPHLPAMVVTIDFLTKAVIVEGNSVKQSLSFMEDMFFEFGMKMITVVEFGDLDERRSTISL
jgi:hypothetical protein